MNFTGVFTSQLAYVSLWGVQLKLHPEWQVTLEMKALEIGEKAREAILSRNYDQVKDRTLLLG
ncbi:hypothetical protein Hanom_Chr09g00779111 [Helianthus anomalus]